jgi:hypothetical protein
MMLVITEDAIVVCKHEMGKVSNKPSQSLVTIMGRKVLVETDPEGREISGCPNVGAAIKPCMITLRVKKGYSELIRVDNKRLCLDSVRGLTDGTPPGTVEYKVNDPGQHFVSEME